MSDEVEIGRVSAEAVRPLRSAVLRPGAPPEALVYESDAVEGAVHFGARAPAGIVGIVSLAPEPLATAPDLPGWRLRSMATDPAWRGRGLGVRLVQACLRSVREAGGGLLWCNARRVALGFYGKLGFVREGGEFEIPGIGPHFVMHRLVPRLRPARVEEADALTALARSSKASWGYSAAENEAFAPALRVAPGDIAAGRRRYVVAVVGDDRSPRIVGFHSIEPGEDGAVELDALFIAPEWQGRGIGRDLFLHAREESRREGARAMRMVADPNAAAFYAAMGARQDGDCESESIPGRRLPVFVLDLC